MDICEKIGLGLMIGYAIFTTVFVFMYLGLVPAIILTIKDIIVIFLIISYYKYQKEILNKILERIDERQNA